MFEKAGVMDGGGAFGFRGVEVGLEVAITTGSGVGDDDEEGREEALVSSVANVESICSGRLNGV